MGAPGDRRLLRFSVSIPNLGSGSVVIPPPNVRPDLYSFDKCHQHDHLVGFASYELVDSGNAGVTVGRKQGFFIVDEEDVHPNSVDVRVKISGHTVEIVP
ncbi:MAG TPA: lysyl oxidase family protein [Archangium sp.]|nr:lysyl oxidase family protein [Archangium sp.]